MVLISWSRHRPPKPGPRGPRAGLSDSPPDTARVTERGPERAERERADKGPLSRAWSSCRRALPALVPASERVSPLNMHRHLSRSRETWVGWGGPPGQYSSLLSNPTAWQQAGPGTARETGSSLGKKASREEQGRR